MEAAAEAKQKKEEKKKQATDKKWLLSWLLQLVHQRLANCKLVKKSNVNPGDIPYFYFDE